MAHARNKEQYQALLRRASDLIAGGVSYRAARAILVDEFGCSVSAAHRAYHRVLSGNGDNWGGKREGAGRPKNELIPGD